MEFRQLEYFVVSVEEKSFYKAGEKLYTSQPAISKSIGLLEKELNQKLLERSSRGLKLTMHGERFYHYAKDILRQVDIAKNTMQDTQEVRLTISSYPSKLISTALADFYTEQKDTICLEYQEGSVQDIIDFVYKGVCELGILYISPKQEMAFKHILAHKHLEFVPLKESELCVYVGAQNELNQSGDVISVKELSELKYIRGVRDFFSVEHHFDYVSLSEIDVAYFDDRVLTNSDHLVNQILDKTDLCYLGIHFNDIKRVAKIKSIEGEKRLTLGYIKNKSAIISKIAMDFLECFQRYV
ncbi:MAG: LysR family transcriptional regulator [Anaerotignum sp.]